MCGIQAPRPNPSRPSRQVRTRRHNQPAAGRGRLVPVPRAPPFRGPVS
jgi:hypothetical protein